MRAIVLATLALLAFPAGAEEEDYTAGVAGKYAVRHGPGGPVETGDMGATLELKLDSSAGVVAGCLACKGRIETDGIIIYGKDQHSRRGGPVDARLLFHPTAFDRDGWVSGTRMKMQVGGVNAAVTRGSWAGRVTFDRAGTVRTITIAFHAIGVLDEGREVSLVGMHYGPGAK